MTADVIPLASRRNVRPIYADQLHEVAEIATLIAEAVQVSDPEAARHIGKAVWHLASAYEELTP